MGKFKKMAGMAVVATGLLVPQFGFSSASAATSNSTGPVTLQMLSLPSNSSGLQTGWWANIIEKQVGVKLNIIPAGDQGDQKLEAYMASGQLPDIVIFHTKQQVQDAIRAHLLVNLDKYKSQLPNVFKNGNKAIQFERGTVSNGTGDLYALPNSVGPADNGTEPNWGAYVRWDLYKKLGMPTLNSMNDLLPMLLKMQKMDPTTPSGQKVYAFSFWKDWDSGTMQQAETMADLFGYDDGDQLSASLPFFQVDLKNGKTESILAPDSEYIKVLKLYYKANQMGLVDPDSLTQTFPNAQQKMAQGQILFGWWSWFGGVYNTPDHVNAAKPSGFRPIFPKDTKVLLWGNNTLGDTWSFGIGASTQHLDAALKYLNFMYSTDGMQQLLDGPKGVTWNVNSQGKPYITKNGWKYINDPNKQLPGGGKLSDGTGIVNSYGLSPASINPKTHATLSYGYWPSTLNHNPTKLMTDWSKTTGYKTTVDLVKANKLYVTVPTAFKLISTMPDNMQELSSQIGQVVDRDSWLAVFANNDAQFNQYINDMRTQANGLGLPKLLAWDGKAWRQAQQEAKKYGK